MYSPFFFHLSQPSSYGDSFVALMGKTPVRNNAETNGCALPKESELHPDDKRKAYAMRSNRRVSRNFIGGSDSEDDFITSQDKSRATQDSTTARPKNATGGLSNGVTKFNSSANVSKSPEKGARMRLSVSESPIKIDSESDESFVIKPVRRHANLESSIISLDSDSSPANSPKKTPTKKWEGPDFKLNLKPLGIDKQLTSWIKSIKSTPLMASMPVSENFSKIILKPFRMDVLLIYVQQFFFYL